MSAQMRIVLRTICVFDAFLLVLVGLFAMFYVDAPPGPLIAGGLWLAAGALVALGRHIDPKPKWDWS